MLSHLLGAPPSSLLLSSCVLISVFLACFALKHALTPSLWPAALLTLCAAALLLLLKEMKQLQASTTTSSSSSSRPAPFPLRPVLEPRPAHEMLEEVV